MSPTARALRPLVLSLALASSLAPALPARAESHDFAVHFGAGGAALADTSPYGLVLHGAFDWQLAAPVALEAMVSGGAFFPGLDPVGYLQAGVGMRFRVLDDDTGYLDEGGSPHGGLSIAPHIGLGVLFSPGAADDPFGNAGASTRLAFTVDAEVGYQLSIASPLSLGVFVRPTLALDDAGVGFVLVAGLSGQIELDAPSRMDPDDDADGVRNRRDRCPATPAGTEVDRHGCVPLPPVIVLEGITFAFDSAAIEPTSEGALREAVEVLEDHPALRVEIAGHTDDQGDADYNLRLSRDRAEAVAQYLVEHGVARDRLVVRGYGSTRPRDRGTDEAARARNRRIELTPIDEPDAD